MAVVAMFAGGIAGFLLAVISLVVLNAGWALALGMWVGFGTIMAMVVLAAAVAHHVGAPAEAELEHA